MSAYEEFTGKTVEEALRNARTAFEIDSLEDLDFEILTPGSRGVLGMGAELARIIAAPRSALGGSTPRREAAAAVPLPPPPPRPERSDRGDRGDRDRRGYRDRDRDRGRGASPRWSERTEAPHAEAAFEAPPPAADADEPVPARPADDVAEGAESHDARPRRRRGEGRGEGRSNGVRNGARDQRGGGRNGGSDLNPRERAEVTSARSSLANEREEIQAADASPEALAAGKEILEQLLELMEYRATVTIHQGDTSKLDVVGADEDKEALGALIGRKGERLSALQHLVNLMLSRRTGSWTRVLVDVEDYRGRRERQLRELAERAAQRVLETGAMLQLEPMPALERRWVHLALRPIEGVATQSIGDEPQRRVVVLPQGE